MNFTKEIIKGKRISKKGFTLIELIIVLSLIGVITSTQIVVISKYMNMHRLEINESREEFYVNEAFMIIENQISNAKSANINKDEIVLKRYDGKGYDYIRKDKDFDIIISYGNRYSSTTDNILKTVGDFKVDGKGNLAYVTITTKRGKIYERCLGIERKEALY